MKRIGIIVILIFVISITSLEIGLPHQVNNAPAATPIVPYQVYLPVISNEIQGYFVSPNGSDSNPGTFLKPWRTFAKAASIVLPGDTVYVRGGVYNEAVSLNVSGTRQKPINFLAYPGEKPIIDGNNQLPAIWTGLFYVAGDWIRIAGFEVRNSRYTGVQLHGQYDQADHIFSHHNQRHGIYVQGDFGTVEDSYLWRNAMLNENNQAGNGSAALATARDSNNGITDYAVLRNNTVWENWGIGIDTYESNGTVIEGNIVHDNLNNIYISDATNILFRRNFTYTDPSNYFFPYGEHVGIMIGDELYTPHSTNITIINNISFGNRINFALWKGIRDDGINNILIANNTFVNSIDTAGVILRGYHQNVRFENNLVQQDGDLPVIDISLNSDLTFSNNLWSKVPPITASGPGDVIADPQLSKTGSPYAPEWFKLTASSPAINRALLLPEVVVDYFINSRGNNPDVGAVEYIP